MWKKILTSYLLLTALNARNIYSQETALDLTNKKQLSQEDLAEKHDGAYFSVIPAVSQDPDKGTGGVAIVQYFINGSKDDPLFSYTPYKHRFLVGAEATTNGYYQAVLQNDSPYIFRDFRLRTFTQAENNIAANYFGVSSDSLKGLVVPDTQEGILNYNDYRSQLKNERTGSGTYWSYNKYHKSSINSSITLEKDFFGGAIRPLGGLFISYNRVADYTGTTSDIDGKNLTEGKTRLRTDVDENRIQGFSGGFDNRVKLGIAYDTRDLEVDPNSGWYVEAMGEFATKAVGSDYTYAKLMFSPKYYYSPIPKYADLVIAGRWLIFTQVGDLPFFSLSNIPQFSGNIQGLGGSRTLRGYRQDRFVAPAMNLVNLEVRWTFFRFRSFGFILAPFVDAGKVYDSIKQVDLSAYKFSYGTALRVAYKQSTMITFDLGFSPEGTGFYINLNHIF